MTVIQEHEVQGVLNLFDAAKLWDLKFERKALPKDKNILVNGFRLHYLDWGSRGKNPMLLLHGGGQTAHSWDFFALCMRNEYHIYALDQRGHGDSKWSPECDYSYQAHQRDLEGFVQAMKLRNFILVGLSMGAHNAYTYAATHWTKLAGLVIVDAGPEVLPEGGQKIREFMFAPSVEDSFEAYVERAVKFNPRRPSAILRRSLRHNLRHLPNGKWTWKCDPRRMLYKTASLAELPKEIDRRWNCIRSIRCPTLIVRGAESDHFTEDVARRMQQAIPNSQFVTVSNAGHTVMGDNPPEFERRVREFLATLEPVL